MKKLYSHVVQLLSIGLMSLAPGCDAPRQQPPPIGQSAARPLPQPTILPMRSQQIQELFGIRFPDDFFRFWDWYSALSPELQQHVHNELGVSLVGPFDVLAGKFDDVDLRYPAVLHWRYQFDPPEFFTVLRGDTDGLHWGYWFDSPGKTEPTVAAFYASDAYELWTDGDTLFAAVDALIDDKLDGARENIEYDPEYADDYRQSIQNLTQLKAALPSFDASIRREATRSTPEGMGVVLPNDAGEAGDALLRAKQLWFDGDDNRFQVIADAYDQLNRPALARVARIHSRYVHLPYVDILEYEAGDYHSFEHALEEPENVKRLEVGGVQLESVPDLSSLTNLEELVLWGNRLTSLPASLAECKKIRYVNLHRNELTELPPVLLELQQLRSLQLSRNKISAIDTKSPSPPHLEGLLLLGNPIPEDRRSAIQQWAPNATVTF